jgi:hypothetical protein
MKIHQLFKSPIPDDVFSTVLACFGYENVDDRTFSRIDLIKIECVEKMNRIKEELANYYLPCKARLYLCSLDEIKCITVFRQILRIYGLSLVSRQKYIKQKKITIYSIKKNTDDIESIRQIKITHSTPVVIQFS